MAGSHLEDACGVDGGDSVGGILPKVLFFTLILFHLDKRIKKNKCVRCVRVQSRCFLHKEMVSIFGRNRFDIILKV